MSEFNNHNKFNIPGIIKRAFRGYRARINEQNKEYDKEKLKNIDEIERLLRHLAPGPDQPKSKD